jgi:NhaA family Na+:H+ antiporter
MRLTRPFIEFFRSEKTGGTVLLLCTVLSILAANGPFSGSYVAFWQSPLFLSFGPVELDFTLLRWINDGLMAAFFLLVGLEIRREMSRGELSDVRSALFPAIAAAGGMIVPASLHYLINRGTPTQAGFGIPMATDIAFALGVLSLLGNRVPPSLKVFLAALAIMDDLGAILVIALFYTKDISLAYLGASLGLFAVLIAMRRLNAKRLLPYILAGTAMWYCMVRSGIHPTIAGVLFAFAIPSGGEDSSSLSSRVQHFLHAPVAYVILPVFALANTGIRLAHNWQVHLLESNSVGILSGLVIGKPAGIVLFSFLAVAAGLCSLPEGMGWAQLFGTGVLAGIGFTMSIFISNLAFSDPRIAGTSVTAVLAASAAAGLGGYLFLSAVKSVKSVSTDSLTEGEAP